MKHYSITPFIAIQFITIIIIGHYKEKRDRGKQRKRGEEEEEGMLLEGEWIEELRMWTAWDEGLKSPRYDDYQCYQ